MADGFSLWGVYVKLIYTIVFGMFAILTPVALLSGDFAKDVGLGAAILAAFFSFVFGWAGLYFMYPSVFKNIAASIKG